MNDDCLSYKNTVSHAKCNLHCFITYALRHVCHLLLLIATRKVVFTSTESIPFEMRLFLNVGNCALTGISRSLNARGVVLTSVAPGFVALELSEQHPCNTTQIYRNTMSEGYPQPRLS